MNIAQLLVAAEKRAGRSSALVCDGNTTEYTTLVERVARLAAALADLGLNPGDRVVVLLPNSVESVEILWASFWGGFVVVPLNWHLHPDEVGYIVGQCGASAIVVGAETISVSSQLAAEVKIVRVRAAHGPGVDYEWLLASANSPATMVDVRYGDPAWLFYTSGTTGRPKGATLTHRNLEAMVEAYVSDLDPVADGSVYLHAAPLSHGSGLYLLPATARAALNVIAAGLHFSADDYLDLVETHAVSHGAFLSPTMLRRIVGAARDRRLPSLRSIVVGGAPLYERDLRAAIATFGEIVVQMYGQGEAPMTICVMAAGDQLLRPGSCGRPFKSVEVRATNDNGGAQAVGHHGEIEVRGDVVMQGYWNDAGSTRAALVDGWLRTGDIGYFDGDGYLYLTDRAKDVIITGGSNVYPREVEEVLLVHPAVREAVVVGMPDPDWGESVHAFVVAGDPVDEQQLRAHCRAHLASFKKPRKITFLSELPKNSTGKILRRELRTWPSPGNVSAVEPGGLGENSAS